MVMSNLRYLATTTILGMVLSYSLHQYHGEDSHRSQDCSAYDKGKGLDTDGKPFQVKWAEDYAFPDIYYTLQDMAAFYPYYLCEHVHPTTKLIHFIATFNALSLMGRSIIGEWQWAGLGLALVQV